MKRNAYLFDTHALLFWNTATAVSKDFITFFDKQERQGSLYISSISFWEVACLVKKKRVAIADVHAWKNDLLGNTNIQVLNPTAAEMIDSTLLPDIHKDPFDRVLIAQANQRQCILVTQDQHIQQYQVQHVWL